MVTLSCQGINSLLVASQTLPSVILPFVAFPPIYLTLTKAVTPFRRSLSGPNPHVVLSINNVQLRRIEVGELVDLTEHLLDQFVDLHLIVVANVYAKLNLFSENCFFLEQEIIQELVI